MQIKRRRRREDTGTDDWLMTYADMITLLMCFFVILLSISLPQASKLKEVEDMLRNRFAQGGNSVVSANANELWDVNGILPERSGNATRNNDKKNGRGQNEEQPKPKGDELITLELSSGALFSLGSASLSSQGEVMLDDLLPRLQDPQYDDFTVTVEGHTDDEPISTAQFPSNWELSSARAGAVVRYLGGHGISPGRMRAIGYADVAPKVPNRSDDGSAIPDNQATNRRVVIRLEKVVRR